MKWVISLRWIDATGHSCSAYWSPRLRQPVPWGPQAARVSRALAEATATEDLRDTSVRWSVIPEIEAV